MRTAWLARLFPRLALCLELASSWGKQNNAGAAGAAGRVAVVAVVAVLSPRPGAGAEGLRAPRGSGEGRVGAPGEVEASRELEESSVPAPGAAAGVAAPPACGSLPSVLLAASTTPSLAPLLTLGACTGV